MSLRDALNAMRSGMLYEPRLFASGGTVGTGRPRVSREGPGPTPGAGDPNAKQPGESWVDWYRRTSGGAGGGLIGGAGFDESTYGKPQEFNVPPGWTVNPATGALIPPGGGEVQGEADVIYPGEFFEMGGALYQWNGRSITEASQAEERGFSPTGQTRAGLRGMIGEGGGGGSAGPSPETIKQNRFQRTLDYLQAIETERLMSDQSVQTAFEDLAAIAPDLASGMEFRGGYGPHGGATLLELMQGGTGAPMRTTNQIVPASIPMPREPDYKRIESLLGPLI